MPQALGGLLFAAFGAAGVSAGATMIAGTTLASIVGGVILTAASLALSYLLAPKPKLPKPSASYLPLRQSIPPRITGYGEARPPFFYMLYETINTDSHDVFAWHHGRVAEITRFYMNDDVVTVNEDGLIPTSSQNNKYISDGRGFVRVRYRLGRATETPYGELIDVCAQEATESGKAPIWTIDHRGDGIASMHIIQTSPGTSNFMDRFPRGLYTPSVAARLSYVYDPRAPEQNRNEPATWQWSDNPIVTIADYLTSEDHGMGLPWEELFGAGEDLGAEADICDEATPLKAGGFEKRYRLGGSFQHDNPPADVLAAMLATCDGWFAENGDGTINLLAGKYRPPTVTFRDEHVLSYTVQRGIADESVINEFIPTYTSRDHEFAEVEGQPWRDEQDISDRGRVRSEKLDISWCQSHGQARRLCKRQMLRQSARLSGSIKTRLYGLVGLGERYIKLEVANCPDLCDLVIEIVAPPRVDLIGRFVQYEWKSVNPNAIDAWDPDTEEGDAPPIPVKTSAKVPQTPSDIEIVVEGDADRSITAVVSFDDLGDKKDVYILSLRLVKPDGAPTRWVDSEIGSDAYTIAAGRVSFDILGLAPDTEYELKIQAKNGSGRLSPPSGIEEFDTKRLAPRAPSAFIWDESAGRLRWEAPLSDSFYCARIFRAVLGASFDTATDVSGAILGDPGESQSFVPAPGAAASYWVVAESNDALRSSPIGPVDLQETAPPAPTDFQITYTPGSTTVEFGAVAPDSSVVRRLRFYRGTTAQPITAATQIASRRATANLPVTGDDTPGPGTWRYWVRAFTAADTPSDSPEYIDVTVTA